jgi:endonuclease YncB( thermonuclease family)
MSRSFRRWPRFTSLGAVAFCALMVLLGVSSGRYPRALRLGAFSTTNSVARAEACEVQGVLDSATLLVRQPAKDGQPEFVGAVRLLGIFPPDGKHAAEAIALLKERTSGPDVRLELDKRRLNSDGLFLAYVYANNQHLTEELVAAGLARVETYPGDSMTINRQLRAAQDRARIKQVGIWAQ